MTLRLIWLSTLFAGLLAAGLVSAEDLTAELAGETFSLELADDPEERRQGLMGRTELKQNAGMLFDFPPGITPAIWMRNMHIPLDLIYLDEEARITHLFRQVPPCEAMPCTLYRADRPLRFVIEVPAGTIDRLNLEPGDTVDLQARQNRPAPRD
ncbi:hypothetical protein SAMN05216421_2941 [Halopseudomonas xinjiangensis]|uniref:DUF192 domain-containing protein n=1 Tax=Halopseudomonas xinjiangensis TaxID=487184 RepID=A0A1H1XRQ3_9GAMM|nr:DUF192 domain-containing protein [Halopseudomonas xinjiangensis]SDT11907.1 hypothetical protein SAMN05216421_2941 [Halopseudomonas xinjiangensis]